MDIKKLQKRLKQFASERDWEQFHNPKNLAIALSVEVAELMEIFQWSNSGGLNEIKDPKTKIEIEEEMADILNYIMRLSDVMEINLEKVAYEKIIKNEIKYPIDKCKGSTRKYNK
tara:strand:- start:115 stop:459 length:345 start_codon:yes stop_codon:yes gene_type:complete